MKAFTIYISDGSIIRSGHCQDHMINMQSMLSDESVIEGISRPGVDTVETLPNGTKAIKITIQ